MSKNNYLLSLLIRRKAIIFFIFLAIALYGTFYYQGNENQPIPQQTIPDELVQKVKLDEKYYMEKWSKNNQGITEYSLPDRTRVDVLTDDYAVEVDFANKWYQSVGQSLHYALHTKKNPGIVLISRSDKDKKYIDRLVAVIQKYKLPITVWKMTENMEHMIYKPILKKSVSNNN